MQVGFVFIIKMQLFENSDTKRSQLVTNIPYLLFLVGLLIVIIIHFEMVQNSSLFDILSLLLGFIFCLILQLKLIAHYFKKQIKEFNLSEFGVIKNFIKTKIFGELNLEYVRKKNKEKYYQHTKNKDDPLFSDVNSDTFECVIAKMRRNSEIDNYNRIRIINGKWDALIFKISHISNFFDKLLKLYKERNNIYKNKYESYFLSVNDDQIQKWRSLFDPESFTVPPQQTNKDAYEYIQGYKNIDWHLIAYLIRQRVKLNQRKIKDISQKVIQECSLYLEVIKGLGQQGKIKIRHYENQYADAKRKTKQNKEKITEKKKKVQEATKKIKKIDDSSMQQLFAIEYEVRSLNFDLEKLEIKKVYDYDMLLDKSQLLFRECVIQDERIEQEQIFTFNKKIMNYIVQMHEAEKKIVFRRPQDSRESPSDYLDFEDLLNVEWVIDKYKQIETNKKKFKQYLMKVRSFLEDLQNNLNRSSKIFQDYQKQISKYFTSENQSIYSLHQKIHDNLLIISLKKVNEQEYEMILSLLGSIKEEIKLFEHYEAASQYSSDQIRALQEKMNKIKQAQEREKKSKKPKTNSENYIIQTNTIIEALIKFFKVYSDNKAKTNIISINISLLASQWDIYRYIDSKKQELQCKTQSEKQEDIQLKKIRQRMNEYKDELFKREMKEQQEESLRNWEDNALDENNRDEEQREKSEKSIELLNKLLTVFLMEWSDSQFFHEFLKEELEISLNRKKPPIVSYITIKYIKVVEKQRNLLENIIPLGDHPFMCALEVEVNFKGKIAVHIETEIKRGSARIPINVILLIRQFQCPLRVCFTPFSLGKSYASMMRTPKIEIEIDITVGKWNISNFPLITKILKTFVMIKLRKKFLWPKRSTLSIPLAVKNPINLAIRETLLLEKQLLKKNKMI